MSTLIDTSLWIDFTRARTPKSVKQFIEPFILDPSAHLAEPITFEMLRHATPAEARTLGQQFQAMPVFSTPIDLWTQATLLGQTCRRKGVTVRPFDLLIATVAIHHAAEVVTFDDDFQHIANVSSLRIRLLQRPP
jgi:predicted nucleic acid-binding protein